MRHKIVVLSGAGISAESGIKTFRDADGLWEGHDVMSVASPEGWEANKSLVLDFYNQRRRQLDKVAPNAAHIALANLQKEHDVIIITQNVDDLHERAGSENVIHLHGELLKSRSIIDENQIYDCKGDINVGDCDAYGNQLRPHIVWFGEMVPMIEKGLDEISDANIVIVVGTSMQVYPAASLIRYAPMDANIYYVDPKPSISHELSLLKNLIVVGDQATVGIPLVIDSIKKK